MQWVWNWGGECFGYIDAGNLWTYDGKHVGKLRGSEIYGPDGSYLGEVMSKDRLITNLGKRNNQGPSFAPLGNRGPYAQYAGYAGYAMYAGHEDFPSPDSF